MYFIEAMAVNEENQLCNLANSMAKTLLLLEQNVSFNHPCPINRIPANIRQYNSDAYDPQIVSVGPYHHGKPTLQSMEEHKWRYLRDLLARNFHSLPVDHATAHAALADELKKLIARVRELETRARRCYPDSTHNINHDKFVMMMVLDGCFIVELLIKFYRNEREDPLFAVAWILPLIRRDLLRLENQLPFFVLEHLFKLIKRPRYRSRSGDELELPALREVAYGYLMWRKCEDSASLSRIEIHHLLHLYDIILLPKRSSRHNLPKFPERNQGFTLPLFQSRHRKTDEDSGYRKTKACSESSTSTIPSATELQEAGVGFKCRNADSFIDVEFRNGVLEIPRLSIVDSTSSTFHNLIAFEQCSTDKLVPSKHFTSFALLFDCLVNSTRDVTILIEQGIIENKLGNIEQVAELLKGLRQEIIINYQTHHFADMFEKVNRYCGSSWHRNQATLRRYYFKNPWSSISVAAAAVMLALTIIEVVFDALSYACVKP